MDQLRWARVQSVFDVAVRLPPAERTAYLEWECSEDPVLRLQVETLISADESAGLVDDVVGSFVRSALSGAVPGQRVGPYELVRELGRGGMGVVYLARRADEEYRAEVAIKLLRGLETPEHVRRFLAERQILATLDHPNIARLLDGGTTAEGVPYLVMERVDGVPITDYCDERGLTIGERLELFGRVCEAVRAAHRSLVIHRDLKPGNIVVTGEGVPKLLDFGIAKLLDPSGQDATRTGLRAMTPAYASPEQIRGEPPTVGMDVYGLGLVLYELLTGRLPYDARGLSARETERVILESEPTRPSVAVTRAAAGESPEDLARKRSSTPPRLRRRLEGDIDSIALTALRKDPSRRYDSVDRLTEDVTRHLEGQPVLARGDTWSYRAGKFVRRHRVGVGIAATAVLLLTGVAAAMTAQAERVARERDAATVARADAEQVAGFLVDLFEVANPEETSGADITAREILDRGAERVATELGDQPATRATMMAVIGRVYQKLGLYEQSAPLLDSALAIRTATYGVGDARVAESLHAKAELLAMLGRYDSARVVYRRALALRRRVLPAHHRDLALTLDGLATVESDAGNYDVSEALQREALAIRRVVHGNEHTEVAAALVNLGTTLRRKGSYEAAEPLLREGLEMRRRLLDPEHVDVAHALNQLARLFVLQGRPAEAEPLAREGLAIRRTIFGDSHVEVAASLGNLSGILGDLGDHEGALAARSESLEVLRAAFGEQHPYVAATLQSLASAQQLAGQLDSARVNYERAVAMQRRILAPEDPNRGFALTGLGRVLVELGRHADAEAPLREALDVRRGGLPADHWFIAATEEALGTCLAGLGRHDEASALLTKSFGTLTAAFGEQDERTVRARESLAAVDAAIASAGGGGSAARSGSGAGDGSG